MSASPVDLSELAIDRDQATGSRLRIKQHLLTRYLIPAALLAGFLSIVGWAARDTIFPPLDVQVVPVIATQDMVRKSGTPLFNAAGWIEPCPTAIRVPGLAPGVVEDLLVVEDQEVEAGDPVAELIKDDARLTWEMNLADQKLREAEVKHASAALAAANTRLEKPVHLEAELAAAETSLATIQTELSNLPFELSRAQSAFEFAENDYRRHVNASNSVSQREVDDARTRSETMKAMVDELQIRDSSLKRQLKANTERRDALKEQLELLIDEIRTRDQSIAQVAMAEARLEQCIVAVAESKLRLDRMTVRAPVPGRVLTLVGQPGTRIGGRRDSMSEDVDGSTVITMYDPRKLQVQVDVRFEDLPSVSLGQPVRIDNPALDDPLTGSVLFISSEADIQKNTLDVKVAIDNPPEVFKPEMLVDVTFLAPELKHSHKDGEQTKQWKVYVPQNLISEMDGKRGVWVADRARNVAKHVAIETGDAGNNQNIEVTRGLDVTSRLIVSPRDRLKAGQKIRIEELRE